MGLLGVFAAFLIGLLVGTAALAVLLFALFVKIAKTNVPVRPSLLHRSLHSKSAGDVVAATFFYGADSSAAAPAAPTVTLVSLPAIESGQGVEVVFPLLWDIPAPVRRLDLADVFSREHVLSGKLWLQPSGKERLRFRYQCDLHGSLLACQNLDDTRTTVDIYDLAGCQIRHTSLYKNALEIVNTHAALAVGHFHMFMLFAGSSQQQEWLTALLQQGLRLASQTAHEALAERLKRGERPQLGPAITCTWINRLLARWYQSMKDGGRLRAKVREKLAEKVSVKLFEKGMESKFQDLRLANVKVGSTAPTLGPIYLHQPRADAAGVFAFDMPFAYEGEFFFSFTTKFMKLPCKASVMLHSLKGRVLLHVEPNTQLYSIAFYEFPEIKWTVKKKVSTSDFGVLDLQGIIHDKLKVSLSERFVLPNRKYARIPKTNKSYWELPEVAVRSTGRLSVAYGEGSEDTTLSLEAKTIKKKAKEKARDDVLSQSQPSSSSSSPMPLSASSNAVQFDSSTPKRHSLMDSGKREKNASKRSLRKSGK